MRFTNSPLVSYTKISPNRTKNRNHAIDTITIHCVVGQCSVETLGNIFAPSSRQASSNYGVGVDGRIGMYCEEKDRSWCTSNAANDHRAITIEVASDTTHPYAVRDNVYAALIELVADICKRNGIKKLVWSTDKNTRMNHLNGCNMTVHRDYAAKSCPGDYLYQRHGDIAAKVNKILGAAESTVETPSGASDGGSVEVTIWDFLKSKGLNDFAVAGIMGNLYAESALKPKNLQNSYEKKLGYTDDSYTAAVDNGTYTNFVNDKAGYGLVQWTYWSRKQGLLDHAKSVQKSIGDLGMQLDYLWKELQGYTSVMNTLKGAKSILEASNAILTGYERPADQGNTAQNKRAGYGQTYYDKYAGKTVKPSTGVTYRVQVGAFSKKANADRQLAAVQAKGFEGFITNLNGLYKVQVGAYSVKANAEKQLARMKAAGFSDAFISTAGAGTVVATTPTKKSVEEVAKEVIAGKWGNGDARKKALTEAGYDYAAVQKKVNALLS